MRRVVVSEFVTLDGVFEDPGGVEGFRHGGWAFGYDRGSEGDRFKLEEVLEAEALLLGRVTYEGFAEAWPSRSDESGFADKMNSIPKFVASRTLTHADWNNSRVVSGDLNDEVRRIVDEGDGILLVVGSGSVVRHLTAHDLVDEIRLMVFPTVLGSGATLFGGVQRPTSFALTDVRSFGATVMTICQPTASESDTSATE